jgi:hypothetical protein
LTLAQATLENRGPGVLEMLSGRSKKEYAKETQALADAPAGAPVANGATAESDLQAVVAMCDQPEGGLFPPVRGPAPRRRMATRS